MPQVPNFIFFPRAVEDYPVNYFKLAKFASFFIQQKVAQKINPH
jgi:hypothetical protein